MLPWLTTQLWPGAPVQSYLVRKGEVNHGFAVKREGVRSNLHIDLCPVLEVPADDVQALLPVVVGVKLDRLVRRRIPVLVRRRGRGRLPACRSKSLFSYPRWERGSRTKPRTVVIVRRRVPTITALVVAPSAGERARSERGEGNERSVGVGLEEHAAYVWGFYGERLGYEEEKCW